jgi:hypothetical protein
MTAGMHLPEVVSPEEWLAARKDLLVNEKEASLVRHPLFAAVVGAVLGAVLTNPGWLWDRAAEIVRLLSSLLP